MDISAAALLMSYCTFSYLIFSSIAVATLYTSSDRFFEKKKKLFDGRIVSMAKIAFDSVVNFL